MPGVGIRHALCHDSVSAPKCPFLCLCPQVGSRGSSPICMLPRGLPAVLPHPQRAVPPFYLLPSSFRQTVHRILEFLSRGRFQLASISLVLKSVWGEGDCPLKCSIL